MAMTNVCAQNSDYDTRESIRIEGTEMSQLESVMDVLRVMPGVLIQDDEITIIGSGAATIYIGNRKVTELSELNNTTADRVKGIEILKHPGAEYDKTTKQTVYAIFTKLKYE